MKKHIVLCLAMTLILMCLFAISISASTTDEFDIAETSTTIDLTGMSTDAKARVVLYDGTEYHTYPAQYIVTSATDFTVNFDKINAAFEKEYTVASVVRIEIPRHVLVYTNAFNQGKASMLKEVFFPSDSNVYKFNWGCFEKVSTLEKVNIPKSLTEYNGTNHFASCTSLKEVTFDEGYSVSYIPNNFFQSCKSLESLVFPNCVTEINGGAFASCSNLKTIVFGSSLQIMNGSMSDSATSGSTWYLPATFYAENVTSEPPSNMFHWQGNQTNGLSGNNNNPKNITFVFTGTKDEALALQARFKAADTATGENCVGLSRLYDATLCTETEYETLTGKKVGEGATGYYFVYGYNTCKAFYEGTHTAEAINDCQGQCTRCQEIAVLENPTHTNVWYFADENGNEMNISTDIVATHSCEICGTVEATEEIATIILPLGYTQTENGAVQLGYRASINHTALARYEELSGNTLKYGMLAGVADETSDGTPISVNEEGKLVADNATVIVNMTGAGYTVLEIKITGIDKATSLYCNAYAVIGTDVSYICDTAGDTALKKDIVVETV